MKRYIEFINESHITDIMYVYSDKNMFPNILRTGRIQPAYHSEYGGHAMIFQGAHLRESKQPIQIAYSLRELKTHYQIKNADNLSNELNAEADEVNERQYVIPMRSPFPVRNMAQAIMVHSMIAESEEMIELMSEYHKLYNIQISADNFHYPYHWLKQSYSRFRPVTSYRY